MFFAVGKYAVVGANYTGISPKSYYTMAFIGIAPFGHYTAGWLADRIGKAEVTILALVVSGSAGLATAATFGGPVWITATLMILWGIAIVPDSAEFSAIVADSAPPEFAGSLLTFQTALGFALTAVTVQFAPTAAAAIGWPALLAGLALGPAIAIVAMVPLTRAGRTPKP